MHEAPGRRDATPERTPPDADAATTSWTILIVDDEPEIHEVTNMLLAGTHFCGLPVELHSVYSAVDAKTFLEERHDTALILLDIVMETDDAGLRLCRYVREELHNDDVQIVVRTGQPGQAPEREVVVGYGINGYFLKTEVTSQKLHSVLISSLRAYKNIRTLKLFRTDCQPRKMGQACSGTARRLRVAIENDELDLVAQPQIELREGAVVGVELLVRWHSEDQIDFGAPEIVTLAERAGLMTMLGDWVLGRACNLSKNWQDIRPQGFRTAVNISPMHLNRGDLAASVERCLEVSGLPPSGLELEMSETDMMENLQNGGGTLHRLRSLGVGIAIDNFGKGLASLSQLKQLQPDRLKIDRSFVQAVTDDADSAAITRAIIALAHTLSMSVVAEGVETKQQLEFLKWEECEVAQGNYFSAAMPTDHVPALLSTQGVNVQ
jgi:EAL domain-containing protein (putative c-di-GMP-specific phosphodiesterase class I)